ETGGRGAASMNMVFAETSGGAAAGGAIETGPGDAATGAAGTLGGAACSGVPQAPQNLNCGGLGVWQLGQGRGPASGDGAGGGDPYAAGWPAGDAIGAGPEP